MSEKLSVYQAEALAAFQEAFGKQWFAPHDILHTTVYTPIRRRAYTCEILHKKGRLERRVNPAGKSLFDDDYWQYRILKEVNCEDISDSH